MLSRVALARDVCVLDADRAWVVVGGVPGFLGKRHELRRLAAVLADNQVRRCLCTWVAEPGDRARVRPGGFVPHEQVDAGSVAGGVVRGRGLLERRQNDLRHGAMMPWLRSAASKALIFVCIAVTFAMRVVASMVPSARSATAASRVNACCAPAACASSRTRCVFAISRRRRSRWPRARVRSAQG